MDVEMEVTDDEAEEDEDTFKPPQVIFVCFSFTCCDFKFRQRIRSLIIM